MGGGGLGFGELDGGEGIEAGDVEVDDEGFGGGRGGEELLEFVEGAGDGEGEGEGFGSAGDFGGEDEVGAEDEDGGPGPWLIPYGLMISSGGSGGRARWEPSHMGEFLDCLQVQREQGLFSARVNSTGWMPVPSWEPSQKGWDLERPQLHQK